MINFSFLAVKVVDLVKSTHYTCDEYGTSAANKDIEKFCAVSGIPVALLAIEKYTIKSEPFGL